MRQTCQFNGGFYSEEGRRILLPVLSKALIEGMPDITEFEIETPVVAAKQAS
jgi:hypothetical protein